MAVASAARLADARRAASPAAVAVALLLHAGCAAGGPAATAALPPCAPAPADAGPPAAHAWVVDRGWHVEIGLPAAALTGVLAPLRDTYPGAAALLFGFGKRGFMLAREGDLGAWLAGPVPGAGVMQVTALRVPPPAVVPAVVTLPLPAGGAAALERAVAAGFAGDAEGRPVPVAGHGAEGFFEAARGYSLAYTCNTWAAEVLAAAGLPVRAAGVVLAGGVMRQVARAPGACR